ncbi:hypothetical protein SanaruYs_27010 [Chryseotalea sanaruensis]|uniref:LTD domain-containing protein n=1 Tax=Chryseotalea sanaruensis TaxID=2482724 RepID=A0A401UC63_9BACT|nr:T9SS type A sorting domain-containing protein [Chryseotalea sanaruensis]GCC52464.1 hypothetical protein SanaruYs_27010 [Chryseotalea sanaruensis]
MKIKCKILFFSLLTCTGVNAALAQTLRLTEIAYEEWFFSDDDGDFGNGWIELKNNSSDSILISNYSLKLNNETTEYFLPELKLPSGEHLFIWLSGKNKTSDINNLHAPWFASQNVNKFVLRNLINENDSDSVTVYSRPYWYETHALLEFNNSLAWFNTDTGTPGKQNISRGLWKRTSTFSQFQGRDSSPNGALFFNNKFWILEGWLGGGGESAAISDVWCSEDGRNWIKKNDQAPYYPYSAFVVFQDKMWAFDGNAYFSNDGVTWTKVAENLPFTYHSRAAILNNEIFVLDGNAVHKSSDGINWITIQQNTPWESRLFASFFSFKNKLWMFGGGTYYFTDEDKYFNDVWSSVDGVNWEIETDEAEWIGRLWPGSMVFDNKLWVMGGWRYQDISDPYYGNRNDVWYSEDGRNWKELKSANSWLPRHAPLVWATGESLWISSGFLNNYGLHNDVWTIGAFKTTSQTEFYLNDDQSPSLLSSWSTDENGEDGLPPLGFNYDFQNFNITRPRIFLTSNDSLSFEGEKTTLTIGNEKDSTLLSIESNGYLTAFVNLNNFATLVLKTKDTPNILSAKSQSKLLMESSPGDSVRVNARELNNVVFSGGVYQLSQNTLIKNSATFLNANLFGDSSLRYTANASLRLKSTTDSLVVTKLEFPGDYPPGKLIAESQIFINRVRSTVDSIQFGNGKIILNNSILGAKSLKNANAVSYLVTNDTSRFELTKGAGEEVIPIGTNFSYNPILFTSSAGTFKFSITSIDTLDQFLSSVNLVWRINPLQSSMEEYDVQFYWENLNKNATFSSVYMAVYQYSKDGWNQSSVDVSESTNNSIHFQTNLTGFFFVGDNRQRQRLSSTHLEAQYGDIFDILPITVSSGLPTEVISLDNIVTIENNNLNIKGAGNGKLVVKQLGDSVYAPLIDTIYFIINKRDLLVEVLNPKRKVGETDPIFQLKFEGFAYNDTVDNSNVSPEVSTSSDLFSPAGIYDLTINGDHLNYKYLLKQKKFLIVGSEDLQYFPNPTSGYLDVILNENLLGDVRISIIDLNGVEIFAKTFSIEYNNSLQLLLPDTVNPGLYCIMVEGENFKKTGRLRVQ